MIQPPKYRKRTHEFLCEKMRKLQNDLDMRDWVIDLSTEDMPQKVFLDYDCSTATALVQYAHETLTATIWLCTARCITENIDPLFVLYHEVGHIFQGLHEEEWRCNKLAMLLM